MVLFIQPNTSSFNFFLHLTFLKSHFYSVIPSNQMIAVQTGFYFFSAASELVSSMQLPWARNILNNLVV